jgi:hypothetical protein
MKMKWYYPAFGGAMVAILSEIALTAFELKSCKGLGCNEPVPWYVTALPLVFLLGGAAWSGKELFSQWRKLLKLPV